jgi:transposase, IS5 family
LTKRKPAIILWLLKTTTERRLPLRKKIETNPCFYLTVTGSLKIIQEYHKKYDGIDGVLEKNGAILDAFHNDLKKYGCIGGRESKYSSEQILRLALVKGIEASVLRDTIIRVSESDFLRNFTRIGMGEVPNFNFLGDALKCIKPETWAAINALLLAYAKKEKKISGDSLRLDSTVSESNIHYPTDVHLLWDSFRVVARLMRQIREADGCLNCGNRFHDKKIKKLYTFVSTHGGRKNKSVQRKVDKAMRTMIDRVEWIIEVGMNFVTNAKRTARGADLLTMGLISDLESMLPKAEHVARQTRRAWINDETVPAVERIFSIFEDHTELLKRGKTRQPIEFGHLVTLGQTQEKFISFYAVEKQSRHDTQYRDEVLKDHKEKFGKLPKRFTADKNYHISPEDTTKHEAKIPVYAVGKKGRRTEQEEAREHDLLFKAAQAFRAGIEGSISVLKRAFGLKRCLNKGFKSFSAAVGCLVFCHNLVLLSRM